MRQVSMLPSNERVRSEPLFFEENVASAFGPTKSLPTVPFLQSDDYRLDEYRHLELDAECIMAWVNSPDSLLRRNRTQVLDSFPVLVPAFFFTAIRESTKFLDIQVCIDRGDPLIESMSDVFGMDSSSIRFLMTQFPGEVGREWTTRPIQLFWAVRIIPKECRPKSRADWEVLWTYWSQVGLCGAGCFGDQKYDVMDIYPPSRSILREHVFLQLCRNGYSTASKVRLDKMTGYRPNVIAQMGDYFLFVWDWIYKKYELVMNCGPGRVYGTPEGDMTPEWSELLLSRYSLSKLINQSISWHREINLGYEYQAPQDGTVCQEPNDWPALLREVVKLDGLEARSLTRTQDLVEEGRRLKHCVGTYGAYCATGEIHIISIRDSNGDSLSTAEIRLFLNREDHWEPVVRQHYGFDNTAPSPECVRLLELVVLKLKWPESQSQLREISQSAAKNVKRICDLKSKEDVLKKVLPDYDEVQIWLNQKYIEFVKVRVPISFNEFDHDLVDQEDAFRVGICIRCEYGSRVNSTTSCRACRSTITKYEASLIID